MNHESEIINQKLRFLFNAEQTTDHVLPEEEFTYYVFIKNISAVPIHNFKIKIINDDDIIFSKGTETSLITLEPNENKLYTFKAFCKEEGDYIVHFIGQGDNTEILYDTLKIRCSFDSQQKTLTHKIHIYDFSPYESHYSMEAENFSQSVTQIFKRWKPSYKVGQQPFPMLNQMVLNEATGKRDKDWFEENIESQSYIDQYNLTKNCDEYHYHYISRENFTEDSIETFTGQNLQELVDNINQNSIYFNAEFLRSGNNELLNDFTQYAPNGFIHRMGLLNSELYHVLGVLPTYDYMNDYLFRWAPSAHQLPNLYPKKRGMKWDENIWAGKGWSVYRYVTNEYKQTDEYKEKIKNHEIKISELLTVFETKENAERYVDKMNYLDNIERAQIRSDVIKYKYIIKESNLDTGVFFINIPLSKIPSNFIVPSTDELYTIINRAKPFGAKPLIKYSIDEIFNHNMDFEVKLNYHIKNEFDLDFMEHWYKICSKKIVVGEKQCRGRTINSINEEVVRIACDTPDTNLFAQNHDFLTNMSYRTKALFSETEDNNGELIETNMEQYNNSTYILKPDNNLLYLEDILESLYQRNNNNISFYLNTDLENKSLYDVKKDYNLLELAVSDKQIRINIKDKDNIVHRLQVTLDEYYNLHHITNSFIKNKKEYIIEEGFEKIRSILFYKGTIKNKNIIVWFGRDTKDKIHYFGHEIINGIKEVRIDDKGVIDKKTDKPIGNVLFSDVKLTSTKYLYLTDLNPIVFETPFFYKQKIITPLIDKQNTNWNNLHRINNHDNTYAYISNITTQSVTPNDIEYLFNEINLPETALIQNTHLRLKSSTKKKNIYIYDCINTNYIDSTAKTHSISLEPKFIEVYQYEKHSPSFYYIKLLEYIEKDNKTLIEKYKKLLEESILFNESINVAVEDYIKKPNDFITIDKSFWYEVSQFTDEVFKLNETQSIDFIIEGYNTEEEVEITTQTLSDINFANQTKTETIPAGYFRKKISLYYPNSFNTNLFRVRFRFNKLNHSIKIFDTRINIEFKQAQDREINWEYVNQISSNGENDIILLQEINEISDLNNGLGIKLSFDDIIQGEYYHINTLNLYILYKETEMEMLINKNKYNYVPNNSKINSITGICTQKGSVYPSVEFYNDIVTMSQPNSNIGPSNNGIKLQKSIFQSFITRDDNITNIEIFPNGVLGNPDANIKIGLYENHQHSPGKLIKEVYANGWLKNDEELKNMPSIKYNINVDNLKINTTYWFKIEVITPKDNSYYLLKSINTPQNDCKLLINENNNYINTLSALQFNIYSKNLSRSFASIPCLQDVFDNPYIKIGLHKSQGNIRQLRVNTGVALILEGLGEDYMLEDFDDEEEMVICVIQKNLSEEIIKECRLDGCETTD